MVSVLSIITNEPKSAYKELLTLIPTLSNGIGEPQPDQNKATNKKDIDNIFKYSPKKKKAKGKDAYSTLYPATNSASASGKSNGARFVSAKTLIMNITALGSIHIKLENPYAFWEWIMATKSVEADANIIGNIKIDKAISYDIIWIIDLIEPIKANLLVLENPDKNSEYTFIDEKTKTHNKEYSDWNIDPYKDNGITDHIIILKNRTIIGEIIKEIRKDWLGIINFLKSNFKASAIGCNNPKNPTESGPFLHCIAEITLRSKSV